ncbi:MAG TPA: metal-dependent hydrolase [Vicinamibacterales bacterium]|nr:metal-dependent hydrolase [Vicinamibacterales bacterium]
MDNVTHTLFALTLARTPLGRGRGATAALVLASSAPDSDIVAAMSGGASYLAWHRGPTHGPLGIVGLGLLTAAIVWTGRRLLRGGQMDGPATPFTRLVAISVVGVFAHILMDLPTSYGTRFLSPFSWRWFAIDIMPIVDVYLLAVLAGGLLLGGRSDGSRRVSVAIVLTLMVANYGLRTFAHQEALKRADRLFSPTLPRPCDPATQSRGTLISSWPGPVSPGTMSGFGASLARSTVAETRDAGRSGARPCLLETAAIPRFLSPFRWRVIARTSNAYDLYDIDVTDARLRSRTPPAGLLTAISTRISDERNAFTDEAARAPTVRALLDFARFPQAQVVADSSGGVTVQIRDMRFDTGSGENTPLQRRRTSLFTATVRIGAQ